MKKFITLTIILCIVINLCGCKETVVKEYNQNSENENYELKFSSSMAVGFNCSKTVDLVSTAETCKTTDIFDIEEIEILGEHYTPTGVGTAGGEFFAVVQEDERDTLYNISGHSPIEIYKADVITPIFEKDGCFIFAVNEADGYGYNIMSYNPKEKSVKRLFELYEDNLPYFTEAGDYITVRERPSSEFGQPYDYNEKLKVTHYHFNSKSDGIINSIGSATMMHSGIYTKNIKNNYSMSFDYITSQILVWTIDTNEFVSEIYLDVWNKNDYLKLKFFGSRLLMRDGNGLKMHDFEDNTDHMICLLKWEGKNDNEINRFGIICEMIGDVLIFSDTENLLAYDLKNERVATICPLEDVTYTASDNKSTFVYCSSQVTPEGFESILRFKLK
ncbi:MAG: hypothetical protein E7480_01505 [Ruminococcaceae bacterium]|nr:hypothetical protein [Oscillospiraceae bacterium]